MSTLLRALSLLALAASPLAAQTWLDHPSTFDVRLVNDTTWRRASQVTVNECPAFALESDREADGSFIARRFSGASAVRYVDASGSQRQLPDSDLAALRECHRPPPPSSLPSRDCGRAPDSAIALVNTTIARRSTGGSPWAITLGVSPGDVKPVVDGAACRRITGAIMMAGSPDTLSLLSVIQIGPAAYAVVRGDPMGAGTPHGAMSLYLLNPSLEVVSSQRFSY